MVAPALLAAESLHAQTGMEFTALSAQMALGTEYRQHFQFWVDWVAAWAGARG